MDRVADPPRYAWDWFARQRLLWREVHRRLTHPTHPAAGRYRGAQTRTEVLALLEQDLPRDAAVREVVAAVVRDLVFLGRTDVPFAQLGHRNPPRGLRWWWTALTGEALDPPARRVAPAQQLSLDDVHEGYGG